MVFVIHWHESAMDIHVFPIPIPPPTSLSTRSSPAQVGCMRQVLGPGALRSTFEFLCKPRSCCLVVTSYLTLCDNMDCSKPGSSAHGIYKARILEWVAISFSKGSSPTRDLICISYGFCFGRQILYFKPWGKFINRESLAISFSKGTWKLEYRLPRMKACQGKFYFSRNGCRDRNCLAWPPPLFWTALGSLSGCKTTIFHAVDFEGGWSQFSLILN